MWRSISKPSRDSTWLSYRYSTCDRSIDSSHADGRSEEREERGERVLYTHIRHTHESSTNPKLSRTQAPGNMFSSFRGVGVGSLEYWSVVLEL